MDTKLTLLILLIGVVIGLSHLTEARLESWRFRFAGLRWSDLMPGRRRA